jgi:hypothetical protein
MEASLINMLRLFKYDSCNEFSDYPNDLFRSTEYSVLFDYDNDKVTINNEAYKISSILHIQGSGSNANSIESSFFIKMKTNIQLALQNLFSC